MHAYTLSVTLPVTGFARTHRSFADIGVAVEMHRRPRRTHRDLLLADRRTLALVQQAECFMLSGREILPVLMKLAQLVSTFGKPGPRVFTDVAHSHRAGNEVPGSEEVPQ